MMTSKVDGLKTYLFSYQHSGATWGFEIKASSPEDAKARLSKIANARYDGVLVASIPVPDLRGNRLIGWLASLFLK